MIDYYKGSDACKEVEDPKCVDKINLPNMISHILCNISPIISKIFTFLNAKDLSSCALVCSAWNRVAESVKRKRCHIYTIKGTLESMDLSKEGLSSHVGWKNERCRDGKRLLQCLRNISSQPNLILIFGSYEMKHDPHLIFPELSPDLNACIPIQLNTSGKPFEFSSKVKRQKICSVFKYLKMHLPSKCQLAYVPESVIVGAFTPSAQNLYRLSAITISHFPEIEILPFTVPSEAKTNRRKDEFQEFYHYTPIKACTENIKLVLLFTSAPIKDRLAERRLIENALSGRKCEMYVVIEGIERPVQIRTGISFSGNNIKTEIVCCFHENECCLGNQLFYLRKTGFYEKTGIAFLISSNFFPERKFIFKMFPELFPRIALIAIKSYEVTLHWSGASSTKFLQSLYPELCNMCQILVDKRAYQGSPKDIIVFVLFVNKNCEVIQI